jgi:hypothetical protein
MKKTILATFAALALFVVSGAAVADRNASEAAPASQTSEMTPASPDTDEPSGTTHAWCYDYYWGWYQCY